MTLRELKVGQFARIETVGGEGALRQHFLDMGVIPGAEVALVRLAPLGDPMELRGPGELFGTRQSGTLSAGLGSLAGDAELLKLTHDEAQALMAHPEELDAQAVIALAQERFADRLRDVAVN